MARSDRRLIRHWLGWILAVQILISAPNRGSAAPPDEAAAKRLDEVARAYKGLTTYSDRGSFSLTVKVGEASHTTSAPASIALQRPNRIRVETALATLFSDGTNLMTLVAPTRKYTTEPAPRSVELATVSLGPVGSLLLGGPSGPALHMILGLLLAENPVKAVLDQGETLSTEPDRSFEGQPCQVLCLDTVGGAKYRLIIDPSSHLVRAVEVTPDSKAVQAMFPAGVPVQVTSYRWSAGPITTQVPAEAFAAEMPKDFTKVVALAQAGAEKAARPADDEVRFKVQELLDQPAPRVSLTLFDGKGKTRAVALGDLAGKVVVLDFWATWCGPCLAELPEVQKLIETYNQSKKDVVIVALSQDNDPKDPTEVRELIEKTLAGKKLTIDAAPVGRVGLDPSNSVGEAFKVEGYPTLVILDRKGVVRATHVGLSPEIGKRLASEIDALLEGKPIPKESRPK